EQAAIAPIGRPIANTQAYVLDANRQPVPIGIPGELYLGGDGVARGYLNRPELTAERFVSNPFGQEIGNREQGIGNREQGIGNRGQGTGDREQGTGNRGQGIGNRGQGTEAESDSRLYKTGDRVRYRLDGQLEYLGRLDNQVKIRGFRIELGEVETALLSHPEVDQTVVNPWTDADGNQRLVAYVVRTAGSRQQVESENAGATEVVSHPITPSPQPPIPPSQLRSFLADQLPDYMIPAVFMPLDELPRLPNGKLDRRALPMPTDLDLGASTAAPVTETEATLAQIWTELLPVTQVGRDDSFFELGGDSILALQAIAKAHQAGLQLQPRDLFQHQTIARLATVVSTRPVIMAEQGLVTGTGGLTPIQHWFFEQNLAQPHHWNQAVMLQVNQPLQPALLEQAVAQLLEHHDALRASFSKSETGWQQHWSPVPTVPFTVVTGAESELAAAIATTAQTLQTSFDLATGPLLNVAYLEFGEQRRLLLVGHHLAVDGVSWRILLTDLQQIYSQLEQGQTAQLPPKTTSVKHWAARLAADVAELAAAKTYWQTVVKPPVAPLPRDFDSTDNRMAIADRVTVSLSAAETQRLLQEVPKAYSVQINDLLLTALVLAFEPWTGSQQLRLELEGHGREALPGDASTQLDLSRTVGWFTSLFPVDLDLRGATTLDAALKQVKETLRAVPNGGLSYGIWRYLHAESLPSAPAAVRFNYLGQLDQVLATTDRFAPAAEPTGAARSPEDPRTAWLEIDGLVSRRQLRLNLTYSTAMHQQATIASLADAWLAALRQLIDYCLTTGQDAGYTPSDFPHMQLSQGELDDLLADL
ncbi:MAG: condensation domain-containing protein, partial [Cyanobacteria bacterium P01_C01_bin.147]